MAEVRLKLVNYNAIKTAFKSKLSLLTDPEDTSETPPVLYSSGVRLAIPKQVNLYKGTFGVVKFAKEKTRKVDRMGTNLKKIILTGAVFTFVQGDDDKADLKCSRITDIVAAYLENKNVLGLDGVFVKVPDTDSQDWATVNITGNPQTPMNFTMGVTQFQVRTSQKTVITYTEPESVPEP